MNTLYQSLVAVEPTTLVVTILNLFLQLYIIKKFFLDKVLAVLDQRREAADKEISDAESTKQEAHRIKQTYEENMRQAKQEASKLLQNAQKTATERGEEIIRNAQQQAVQLKQKAAQDIAQEKKKVLNDAKDEISDIAMTIAQKTVGRALTEDDRRYLVDEFIRELGDGV